MTGPPHGSLRSTRRQRRLGPRLPLAALALAAACARDAERSAAAPTPPAAASEASPPPPGYVVDSLRPIDEALRRFRAGLAAPAGLEGGAESRDALVRRFSKALERADTAALRRLELTKGEFAYLLYPSSPFTRPPLRQQPEVAWFLQRTAGDAGLTGLLGRLGGRPVGVRGYRCAPEPVVEGENRLWRGCRVQYRSPEGAPADGALFGVIVEREGRFKFVNYANDL